MRAEHESEMEKKRIDKALRMQQRVENVARAKKEQEYRNQVMIKKMKMSWERMNRMKEIKEAIQVDRGARRKREIIERHKWRDNTILQRNILPGPGEYYNNKQDMANNTRGARWGKYKPKSDIDWIMYRSAQIPGPGLPLTGATLLGPGAEFSRGFPFATLSRVLERRTPLFHR